MTRHWVSLLLVGFAAFMTTPKVKDVSLCSHVSSASGVAGGWELIVTVGQKEFQDGYLEVSRKTAHIRDAGALMMIRLEIVKVEYSRGTRRVVRPLGGGQAVVG